MRRPDIGTNWLALVPLLAALFAARPAAADLVSETRTGYHAYQGQTDFFTGMLLIPDLLTVDLGPLVSKYIGETEKNIDELFREAEHAGVILYFDEADALFGKRTEPDPENPYAQDFILIDPETRHWFGQIYYERLDGIYELDGPFSVPGPAALVLFLTGGLAAAAFARRR